MSAGTAELADLSIAASIGLMKRRELSAIELLDATLMRLDLTEPAVHAYAHIARDGAMATARAADKIASKGGWAGPLHGIPIAVKDLFNTIDMPTEAGSRVLAGNQPNSDAAAVRLLREAGAVLIGKTVTHEFAYGQNEPPTRNAWDQSRYPGGSSAGSGVAVAVGSAAGAIGTDTAGSVRTPAAMNGIVGLKPTYGAISTEGVIPSSPSLDHVGPLTRRVADCALLFRVLGGGVPGSSEGHSPGGDRPLDGLRLAVERSYFFHPAVEPAVRDAADVSLAVCTQLGASLIEVSIPELELMPDAGGTIMIVEASRWHRTLLRERQQDYHHGTRVMLELGELLPAAAYLEALQARELLRRRVREAFDREKIDAILAPSTPIAAPPIELAGELSGLVHHQLPANMTGQPSLSVPCGFNQEGLPIGLQIIGRPFAEATLFRIGQAYEEATDWHVRMPRIAE